MYMKATLRLQTCMQTEKNNCVFVFIVLIHYSLLFSSEIILTIIPHRLSEYCRI